MHIDSKYSLVKEISTEKIPNLINPILFNKRIRRLFSFSENVRRKLVSYFLEFEDYFIVDSIPLEICKFARHNR